MTKKMILITFVVLASLLLSSLFYVFWIHLPPMFTRRAAISDCSSKHPVKAEWHIDYIMWFLESHAIVNGKSTLPANTIFAYLESRKHEGLFADFVNGYPQVADAYYAFSILAIFGKLNSVNTTMYAEWLGGLQEEDGGVLNAYVPLSVWTSESSTSSTCWAILALKMIGRLDAMNVTRAIDWLFESCYNETDGSFRPSPSYDGAAEYGHYSGDPELLCDTSLVVQTLSEVGQVEKLDKTKTTNFILTYYNSSTGGFGAFETVVGEGNVEDTFEAVEALDAMGTIDQLNITKTINYILSKQQEEGYFGALGYPNYRVDGEAITTLQTLIALNKLEEPFSAYYNYAIWNYYLTRQTVGSIISVIAILIILIVSWRFVRLGKKKQTLGLEAQS